MYFDSAYVAKAYVDEPDSLEVRKLLGHSSGFRLIQSLPPNVLIRAGDAIHLATALSQSETEIWTNDRHLLRAASHVGLTGRTV